MFSSVGWGEVLIVIIVGIIVVGPERLPRLITDVRALMLAARNAIADARKELEGDFGEDFEEFRKPLSQLNSVRQMGARGFITKTLLDDDDSFLTDLEDSAKDVTGAVKGTTEKTSARSSAGDSQARHTAPQDAAGTRDAEPRETSPGDATSSAASDTEPRVELPQQDEVGQSRDWSNPENFNDAL